MSESNYLSKLEEYLKKQNSEKSGDSFRPSDSAATSKSLLKNTNLYKESVMTNNYKVSSYMRDQPIKDGYQRGLDKSKSAFGLESIGFETRNYNRVIEDCLNVKDLDTKLSYDIKSFLPKETKASFKRKYDLLKAEYNIKETEGNMGEPKSNNTSNINFNSNINQTAQSSNNLFSVNDQSRGTNAFSAINRQSGNYQFSNYVQEVPCCSHCSLKKQSSLGQKENSYLKESNRMSQSNNSRSYINNEEQEANQQMNPFYGIYYEIDENSSLDDPNRQLEWAIIEPIDEKTNRELIKAFLNYEI